MRDLTRLRRSTTDRKIAGVAGGLGRHLDIDPTIIRVLLVVLVFFGGAGLLIYGAFWLFVPEDGTDEAPISARSETRTVVLASVLAVAALLMLGDTWWWGFGGGWPPPILPLLVIGLAAWLVLRSRDRHAQQPPQGMAPQPYAAAAGPPAQPASAGTDVGTDQQGEHTADTPTDTAPSSAQPTDGPSAGQPWGPPPVPPAAAPPYVPPAPAAPAAPAVPRKPKRRGLFGITMAFVLLALGAVAVVEVAGTPLPWAVYPATALAVIGVALLAGSLVGRTTGLVFTGLVAALLLALSVWAPNPRFGDVDARPVRAELLQDSYQRTAGSINLDLSNVQDVGRLDGRVVDIGMRAGEVIVEPPAGVDVTVDSHADAGRLDILGHVVDGRQITNNRSTPETSAPDLHINIDLGFGDVRVSTP
jgi:phage shock protein PspC (stress-responsive transcriptional regulator)